TLIDTQTRVISAREKSENRPCRLRRRTGRRGKCLVVVAGAAFPPASVRILNGTQPLPGTKHVSFPVTDAGGLQATQGKERAVDIIDAPPSIPAAVLFLGFDQIIDGALHCRMIRLDAADTERLENAACYIRARWIKHRIMIGEGNITERLPIIVDIEGSPSAIL